MIYAKAVEHSYRNANIQGENSLILDINKKLVILQEILKESIILNKVADIGWKKSHILDDVFDRSVLI